jgi:mannitol-1-/sugar-/sorbitol-6-phosphatase
MDDKTILHCKAILFDMDGTLVDSSAVIDRAWKWWTARHSIELAPIMAVQQGRPNRDVLQEFASHLDIDKEAELFLKFEEEDLQDLAAIPGANEAVREAQGGRWGIVTSANRTLAELRLKATGFAIPETFISAENIRRGKPDPECYLLGAAALEVEPRDCVVFEDAIAGVQAAKAAGMKVVGVMTNLTEADLAAHIHVPDFRSVRIRVDGNDEFEIEIARNHSLR